MSDSIHLQMATQMCNAEIPELDFSITIERTAKGLEVTRKSTFLSNALKCISNNMSCSSDMDNVMRHMRFSSSYMISPISDESISIKTDVFVNCVNGKVSIPYMFSTHPTAKTIYDCVIPEMKYQTIRKNLIDATVNALIDISRAYGLALYGIDNQNHIKYNSLKAMSLKKLKKLKQKYNGCTIMSDGVIVKQLDGVGLAGVEIEGGWLVPPHGMYHDGSVSNNVTPQCPHDGDYDCGCRPAKGEIHSEPISQEALEKWVDNNYPDKMDSSCGIHVHISTNGNHLSYGKLMSKKFWNYYLKRYQEWGITNSINEGSRFWNRLNGNCYYAKKRFNPLRQYKARYREQSRYSFLNYCYSMHGTLESRLLPTFNEPRIAKSAIIEFIDIVNSYLADNIEEPVYTSEVLV